MRIQGLRVALCLLLLLGGVDQSAAQEKERGDPASPDQSATLEAYVVEAAQGFGFPQERGLAPIPRGQGYVQEIEPNGTFGTATPLGGTNLVVRANVFPNGDVDWYSFTAAAGDKVYAATMTSFSANGSTDSQLRLYQSDGTTLIEFDNDDGALGSLSSTIAGATIPSPGTHFIQVTHSSATGQLRPYELHFRLQSGAPTPESEPNDTPATANPLPASGWVSGARNPALASEQDWFSFTAAAGDTVFLSLDLDPERDNVQWNGRLGIALFGDANNQILVVDDGSTGSVANPLSEAHFMTIKTAGTYYAFVDSATAATGGPTATYTLSVSIHPAVDEGVNCTTYTSTDVPKTIGPNPGLVSSVLTIPGNPRIADIDVSITLNHTFMSDIDAHLRSPAGNDNGIFTDIGAPSQTMMDTVLDDEAGIPPSFTVLRPLGLKPELAYRLHWFDGEDAGGTWTLDLRDDATADSGTLTAWSIRICEPPPPPACPMGTVLETVFSTDFEANDGGFTHSGTQDEWERGLPTAVPITTCNSGVNCWKTDLDNTYNASSNQDLLSPNVNLAGYVAPVVVSWAQRYQMESATFDHFSVDIQQAGGATPQRLFEWLDATMTNTVGSPSTTIQESAGWGLFSRRADSFAGLNTELRFHLDTDTSVQLGGAAIDDVSVTACRPLSADLAITKDDGVASAVPGMMTTYTITASNAGPDPVVGATVADTFPAVLTCTWTCTGMLGGTCTAGPVAGDINDMVNLPAGASVTYTATCAIDPAATGSLVNAATVSSAISDPDPNNNSAMDTDTLTPTADLSITKTDGQTNATAGDPISYTIVVSNPGPSNAPNVMVSDTFPAALQGVMWTCSGMGGATCTAGPVAGNISDTANLPAGSSVTYTANATIDSNFSGTLSNTASLTPGINDPNSNNNMATDTTQVALPTTTLTIGKTVDNPGPVLSGDVLTYTIQVSNTGAGGATNVVVLDPVPANTTYVANSCMTSQGTCSLNGPNVEFLLGSIGPGGMATMTFQVQVDPPPLPPGQINNTGYSVDSDQTMAVVGPDVSVVLVPVELMEFEALSR